MGKEITTTKGEVLTADCFLNFAGEDKYLAAVDGDIYIKKTSDKYELLKKKEDGEKDNSQ
jgi:hypothetical protein